jgi:hypothetical protein
MILTRALQLKDQDIENENSAFLKKFSCEKEALLEEVEMLNNKNQ